VRVSTSPASGSQTRTTTPCGKFPEGRPRHGREEIEEFFAGLAEGWDTFEFTAVAIVPLGDDRVFVRGWLATAGAVKALGLDGSTFEAAPG
jgi:hypothetical protein